MPAEVDHLADYVRLAVKADGGEAQWARRRSGPGVARIHA
jgi:hypothetical protein